jgi:hypothetical protein
MTDHAELLELAELYPLGGLAPDERLTLAFLVRIARARPKASTRSRRQTAA